METTAEEILDKARELVEEDRCEHYPRKRWRSLDRKKPACQHTRHVENHEGVYTESVTTALTTTKVYWRAIGNYSKG
ncbi:hypothetical protein V6N13_106732 [Hibiscus sabdariffa]|uniref:Uncharacterized protein n=1 Tax=Hibiscus sabdariffa TaxID=183260 RepID=A0ABR2F1L8_9ROSI